MPDYIPEVLAENQRSGWIRLRTMILLRWVAILGQIVTVVFASRILELRLELDLIMLAIGIGIIGNLMAMFLFPENKRLGENQNMLMIMFDLLQLALLLFFTGGLNNPFSVLVIAPVAISAASLHLRSTLILGGIAIAAITLLANYHFPLRTNEDTVLSVPNIFVFGNWVAIVISTIFLSAYSRRVTAEMNDMGDALFATQVALSREQKLTDLGGVVAAAAHELGTPLATIKLTSSELMEELIDQPDLYEDAVLIRDQADRCRDILRSMGRAGKDDQHMRYAPASEVLREAADPHLNRGIEIDFDISPSADGDFLQPIIQRKPEIIHGLRNMVQNAVDFARSKIWVELSWDETNIKIRIVDDGLGFPLHMIGRIGDPFVRYRKSISDKSKRPEYQGMGLGLFIAKTLLQRTGAEIIFANGTPETYYRPKTGKPMGAIVEISWQRAHIEKENTTIGKNQRFDL